MATKGDVSDLDTLLYGGKPWVPLIDGFTRYRNQGIVVSDADGGASRIRKKYYNSVYTVSCSFFCDDKFQQDFLKVFFARNEGKRFICYLAADRPIVEPYVVQVTSTWQDSYVSQADGQVDLTMEVFSVRDQELDDLLFVLYQEYGSDLGTWIDLLKIATEALPND